MVDKDPQMNILHGLVIMNLLLKEILLQSKNTKTCYSKHEDYIVDSENSTVTFRKTVVDLTTDEINDLKPKNDEIRAIKNDMLSQSDGRKRQTK